MEPSATFSSHRTGRPAVDDARQTERLARELEALHDASFSWALACCGGRYAEAEDVLQAVYLKILEGKARWRSASSWKTWLFAVIRHTAGELRRRRAWRTVLLDRWRSRQVAPRAAPDPESEADRSRRSLRIRRALGSLTDKQRQVLELVFYHDLSLRETAEVLGLRLGTARTHYQRGKQALRDRLREETDHGSL
jgi:RNA polymerase sigma factor (sigma-70 family)